MVPIFHCICYYYYYFILYLLDFYGTLIVSINELRIASRNGMSMSILLILSMVSSTSNFCVRDLLPKLKSKKTVCCMNCLFYFISMNMYM